MKIDHAIIFGATGLIGSHLIALLAQDEEVSKITAITRREVHSTDPKVRYKKIDFSNIDELHASIIEGSHVFSAIGTTQAQVKGNKDVYRSIDFDITWVFKAAKINVRQGSKDMLIASTIFRGKTRSAPIWAPFPKK